MVEGSEPLQATLNEMRPETRVVRSMEHISYAVDGKVVGSSLRGAVVAVV